VGANSICAGGEHKSDPGDTIKVVDKLDRGVTRA
jgi:hypothetical protein